MVEDRWGRFQATAEALAKQAGAARVSADGARGRDRAEAVTVALDGDGRVAAVEFAADWRSRLPAGTPSDAVREAIQNATTSRLAAWAEAVSDPDPTSGDAARASDLDAARGGTAHGGAAPARDPGAASGGATRVSNPGAARGGSGPARDPDAASGGAAPDLGAAGDFVRRFQEAATGEPTVETGPAVLGELLALLRQVEQGLDEVSAQLDTTSSRTLVGRSRDGQVKVSVTGGGEVREVHYARQWLRHAHAVDIGRQTLAALVDAYAQVDRDGITQLIARSPLGAAQRAVQDPFGLARRMRLTD